MDSLLLNGQFHVDPDFLVVFSRAETPAWALEFGLGSYPWPVLYSSSDGSMNAGKRDPKPQHSSQ
jgi:hypothetical protein